MKIRTEPIPVGGEVHWFWCPGCQETMMFQTGRKPAWEWNGDHEKPTVTPSIRTEYYTGKLCHIFIRDGQIQFLSDCTHELAGTTVPMDDISQESNSAA